MFNPRVLITGGRKYQDRNLVWAALDKLYNSSTRLGTLTVIEGGADRHAQQWAKAAIAKGMQVALITKEAEWDRYGLAAGMKRNLYMAKVHQPDLCLAFPGGRGDRNMQGT